MTAAAYLEQLYKAMCEACQDDTCECFDARDEYGNPEIGCKFCLQRDRYCKDLCDALMEMPEVIAAYKAVLALGHAHARLEQAGPPHLLDPTPHSSAFEGIVSAGEAVAALAMQLAKKEAAGKELNP